MQVLCNVLLCLYITFTCTCVLVENTVHVHVGSSTATIALHFIRVKCSVIESDLNNCTHAN